MKKILMLLFSLNLFTKQKLLSGLNNIDKQRIIKKEFP